MEVQESRQRHASRTEERKGGGRQIRGILYCSVRCPVSGLWKKNPQSITHTHMYTDVHMQTAKVEMIS